MTGRPRLRSQAPGRVAIEVALTALVLSMPLGIVFVDFDAAGRWSALALGQFYVAFVAAIVGAARLRPVGDGRWRRLRSELAGAAVVVLATWAGAGLAHLGGAAWLFAWGVVGPLQVAMFAISGAIVGGVGTLPGLPVFAVVRCASLAWPAWDRLRRTRLLWALSHAQLVAALVLAVGIATVLVALDMQATMGGASSGHGAPVGNAGPTAWALAWFTTRFLPAATALLVLSVAAGMALLPPAALISYLVLRRATGRLETLAAATGALRSGDLAARVTVGGEDEVARLEADFNAMAADLGRTLGDLEAERDRVVGLLDAHRQLIASVSHELRTPVATVRGYLESAMWPDARTAGEAPTGPEVAPSAARAGGRPPWTDLETMHRELLRLERLIDDLFTLSRADVGRLELRPGPHDIGALVRRQVETAASLAWRQRRVEVLAELAPDLPPARADADRLEQVVANLLGNAVRHTPPGGLVVVAVTSEPEALRIDVRDTGEGIAPADLPRVFERFYRGPGGDGRPGAGLGLALVKELVEAMGGSIEVSSAPGEGSHFVARLPRAEGAELAGRQVEPASGTRSTALP